jgi:hypothetical protein
MVKSGYYEKALYLTNVMKRKNCDGNNSTKNQQHRSMTYKNRDEHYVIAITNMNNC